MSETTLEDNENPGQRGTMKWHQDPLWSTRCRFIEALPKTTYTPSGMQSCDEDTIGFVWWEEDEGVAVNTIGVCLNHFLVLYDCDGYWEAAGGAPWEDIEAG